MGEIRREFDDSEIMNFDQSGIEYELHGSRTLSFISEKETETIAQTPSSMKHLYTIVPLLNINGVFLLKLFLCLQVTNYPPPPKIANVS